jgi:hypothetical protein
MLDADGDRYIGEADDLKFDPGVVGMDERPALITRFGVVWEFVLRLRAS